MLFDRPEPFFDAAWWFSTPLFIVALIGVCIAGGALVVSFLNYRRQLMDSWRTDWNDRLVAWHKISDALSLVADYRNYVADTINRGMNSFDRARGRGIITALQMEHTPDFVVNDTYLQNAKSMYGQLDAFVARIADDENDIVVENYRFNPHMQKYWSDLTVHLNREVEGICNAISAMASAAPRKLRNRKSLDHRIRRLRGRFNLGDRSYDDSAT